MIQKEITVLYLDDNDLIDNKSEKGFIKYVGISKFKKDVVVKIKQSGLVLFRDSRIPKYLLNYEIVKSRY